MGLPVRSSSSSSSNNRATAGNSRARPRQPLLRTQAGRQAGRPATLLHFAPSPSPASARPPRPGDGRSGSGPRGTRHLRAHPLRRAVAYALHVHHIHVSAGRGGRQGCVWVRLWRRRCAASPSTLPAIAGRSGAAGLVPRHRTAFSAGWWQRFPPRLVTPSVRHRKPPACFLWRDRRDAPAGRRGGCARSPFPAAPGLRPGGLPWVGWAGVRPQLVPCHPPAGKAFFVDFCRLLLVRDIYFFSLSAAEEGQGFAICWCTCKARLLH